MTIGYLSCQYCFHWIQSKRHRLWFSTNTVNLYRQRDPHPQIEFDFVEKQTLKCVNKFALRNVYSVITVV